MEPTRGGPGKLSPIELQARVVKTLIRDSRNRGAVMGMFGKNRDEQLRHLYEMAAMLAIALVLQVPMLAFFTSTERTLFLITPLLVGAIVDLRCWLLDMNGPGQWRNEKH